MLNKSSKRTIRFPQFRSSKSQKLLLLQGGRCYINLWDMNSPQAFFFTIFYVVGLNEYLAYPGPWLFKVFCRTFGNIELLQSKDRSGESDEELFQNRCQQSSPLRAKNHQIHAPCLPDRVTEAQTSEHRDNELASWGTITLKTNQLCWTSGFCSFLGNVQKGAQVGVEFN